MREAITAEVRAELPAALAGVDAEARRPDGEDELADLMAVLGEFIALTGTGMTADAREEWILVAAKHLRALPTSLVMPMVMDAPRREPFANRLVPSIYERVEGKAAVLDAEAYKLRRLAELA